MKRRAFTLVEATVAVLITLTIAGGMYGFLNSLQSRRASVAEQSLREQAIGAMLAQLEEDLTTTLVAGPSGEAGVKGTGTDLSLLSRAAAPPVGADGPDLRDMQASRYVFRREIGEVHAARPTPGSPRPVKVAGGVARMRFRYYDGEAWQEKFDSVSAGVLPVAVEVGVWFGPRVETEEQIVAPAGGGLEGEDEEEMEESADDEEIWPEPDRLLVIVVPDGPRAGWETAESIGGAP